SPSHVIEGIQAKFGDIKLIVRSSSSAEYNWRSSNAGGFESILNVACLDEHELHQAIQTVMDSYGEAQQDHDQVLIQSCLQDVSMSGVVFTCTLESGAPYYRFNFDDKTGSTESVTTGVQLDLRTVLVSKLQPQALKQTAPELQPVLDAVQELEQLLAFDKLDIEFAVDQQGQVHIFQVRPVVVNHESYDINIEQIQQSIEQDVIRFHGLQPKRADISGDKTLFANMPDWNPAEIIGTKPKPLAFSLYQQLITNRIWAQQRAEYGYRDVRPYPLICSFSGQPYVDVRASFNSFLPAMLPQDTADRLVNAYLNLLSDQPHLHDKVEFDVVLTVWTPDLMTTAQHRLFPYGVTQQDLVLLEQGLKQITCSALTRLESDIASVQSLKSRRDAISQSQCATIDKIYALLDDCKRFGTLAFAHAARAGFVASTILNYLVQSGALTASRRLQFLSSFDTVAGEFERDKAAVLSSTMTREELVQKYGHLRPGTYDVTAQAYWEDPEKYLFPKEMKSVPEPSICFAFSNDERFAMHSFLEQLNSAVDVDQFIQYLIHATQERERVKFEFTKNLSLALDYAVILGQEWGLSRDQMAFMTYSDIERLKLGMMDRAELCCSLEKRANRYLVSKVIELPALIDDETQFYSYERCTSQPNFLGVQNVVADLVLLADKNPVDLSGKIVLIQQADPGYDWLFGENIAGLITQYGGANSHMAIRAAEMGLPAAIGVGEKLYDTLLIATSLELDCLGQTIRIVK
ncbi:MAG: hypothetical protein ISP86_06180, partial [Shewanellaceae bacterium]|nr:hypothetical protein [Shewanellaceae bacterium]